MDKVNLPARAPIHRGEALLEDIASDRRSQAAQDSLWLAAQSWLACGGRVSMNRFLALPATGPKLTQATRNYWIRRAAAMLPGDGPYPRAQNLHHELLTFATRGAWRSWRELAAPPEDASELRAALFWVLKHNDGDTLSERQIYRALT